MTLWREGIVNPLDCDTDWTVGDLPPDLLCWGGGPCARTGCMVGPLPLEGPSPFLVFGGMVLEGFSFSDSHRRRQTVGGKNDTYLD